MSYQHWKLSQDLFIKLNYRHDIDACVKFCKRTKGAVKIRAIRLGAAKKNKKRPLNAGVEC